MKGIVLAGGTGSRLWPITRGLSKQLLPIYDKPMIHYPIATLMAANIREILIITTREDSETFKRMLGDGAKLGLEFKYFIQPSPDGLAQAFQITADEIRGQNCALILGDNLFHGSGLGQQLRQYSDVKGAHIFAHQVKDPHRYGVVEFDRNGHVLTIEEKPENPRSQYAIPGLYFYDHTILEIVDLIKPSKRGELEISSVNQEYLRSEKLSVSVLPRGTTWLDTGTFNSLHDASSYVRALEERQGMKIACLEEVSYRNNWIGSDQLSELAGEYRDTEYGLYLSSLSEQKL
jgi:glucose-1-phosphate thymidylyltransferase